MGVPDIFCCYNSEMTWVECKVVMTGPPRLRGTQLSYLKKLTCAGGKAKIAVQRLNASTYKPASIELYDAAYIAKIPMGMFKHVGQELIFPPSTQMLYKWYYNRAKEEGLVDL